MTPASRRLVIAAGVAAALCIGVGVSHAQIWRGGYGGYYAPRFPTPHTFQGAFNFCRLMFASDHREKRGWSTDYPGADINFSVRLSELTKTRVTRDDSEGPDGDPEFVVVRATDPNLFQCPWVLIEDGGTAAFSNEEVLALREYLQKGGFIFSSDYWGTRAGEQFDQQIGRVLPRDKFPIITLGKDHPIWHMQFEVDHVPQMASIQFWRRSGGGISERGADSATVDARGIADDHGRLMVVMIHNSDIPDGWEREAEDPEYFYKFSPDAYAVGIDVILYALTH